MKLAKLFQTVIAAGLLFTSLSASAYVINPGTDVYKWGAPGLGNGATISWSVMGAGLTTDTGLTTDMGALMPAGYMDAFRDAFSMWAAVANLTFNEVADNGLGWIDSGAESVDIRIGAHSFDGPGGVLAHGYYPQAHPQASGDIHFDNAESWSLDGIGGFNLFIVAAHEIGHALGLGHTNVAGSLMQPYYNAAQTTLGADDIAGIQEIYGANITPNVPESGTLILLAFGLLGMVAARKRAA